MNAAHKAVMTEHQMDSVPVVNDIPRDVLMALHHRPNTHLLFPWHTDGFDWDYEVCCGDNFLLIW